MALSVKWLGAAFTAVLLAAVLLASPAFAQAEGGNVNVQYVDCSQVQTAVADQGQYGVAVGDGATADLAQELGITQEQVNACLGGVAAGENIIVDENGEVVEEEIVEEKVVVEEDVTDAEGKVISSTIPEKKVLAATGGMSLPGTAFLAFTLIGTGLSVLRFAIRRDR